MSINIGELAMELMDDLARDADNGATVEVTAAAIVVCFNEDGVGPYYRTRTTSEEPHETVGLFELGVHTVVTAEQGE